MTSEKRSGMCGIALIVSVLAAVSGQGGAQCAVNAWSTNGPEGGLVTVFQVDPFDAGHVLAGTDGSGIFVSVDGGEHWSRANTPLDLYPFIDTVAFDPRVAGRVYAADGKNGRVLRSDDGGLNWTVVAYMKAFSLGVDPRDSMVYCAQCGGFEYPPQRGFLRSVDGGVTWMPPTPSGAEKIVVGNASPPAPVLLYGLGYGGVRTSSDRGLTWSQSLTTSTSVVALAIHPSRPEIICAASLDGLYATRDGGLSWMRFSNIGSATNRKFVDVAFDPANADVIFTTSEEGLFKTTDFGGTWTAAGPYSGALAVGGAGQGGVYYLTGAGNPIYKSPAQDGIAKSSDGGATWSSKNSGLVAIDVTRLAVDPANTGTVYAAGPVLYSDTSASKGGMIGGLYKSSDRAATWSAPVPVYGQIPAIDPSNPNIVYLGGGSPNPTLSEIFSRSLDGGETWTRMELGLFTRAMHALAIDPSHPATLYAGFESEWFDGSRLLKSIDGGTTWTNLSGYPANNYGVDELAIDRRNPETLYAVGGGTYKSTDGGATWATLAYPDGDMHAFSVAVDSETSTLYVGTWSGVLKSTGGSLSLSPAGLDGRSVGCLTIDPRNPNILYGCNWPEGVFTSADGGATWSALNDGLAYPHDQQGSALSIKDLAIDPRDHTVVHAATNAGVFTIDRNSPPVANAGSDQSVRGHGPRTGTVTLQGSGSSDPDGDPLTFSWSWPGGRAEGVSPTADLPFGTTTITLLVRDPAGASTEDTVQVTVCRGRDPLHPKGCNPSSHTD